MSARSSGNTRAGGAQIDIPALTAACSVRTDTPTAAARSSLYSGAGLLANEFVEPRDQPEQRPAAPSDEPD